MSTRTLILACLAGLVWGLFVPLASAQTVPNFQPKPPIRRPLQAAPGARPVQPFVLPPEAEKRLEVQLGRTAPLPVPQAEPQPKPLVENIKRPVTPKALSAPVKHEASLALGEVRWRQDYESQTRRPIETVQFGDGTRRIVVLSSLSGNSDDSVAIAEQLAGVFAREELIPRNLSVLVIRTPNPDGLANRTLTNSRGVDLNRNFPSRRFTAQPSPETGRPASEPETRAIINVLHQFKPEMVIHLVESRSSRGMIRTDDLNIRALLPSYDFAEFEGVYKTGSLSGYVKEVLGRYIVEVELPQGVETTGQNDALMQLLVLVLDQSVNNIRSQLAPRNLAVNGPQPTLQTQNTGQIRPDGAGGYVEFLPPPPDAPPEVVRSKYIELPPPPE